MLIDFIIPTFKRPKELRTILASLEAQSLDKWKATVIIDDDYPQLPTLDILNTFPRERISWHFSGRKNGDWGHTPREIGKQNSVSDYIIMTGDDNYYTPNTVQEIWNIYKNNQKNLPGMIYWDMVHSSFGYSYFQCKPQNHGIDIGAFATRTDLAQKIKLGTTYDADGRFVEDFKRKFPKEEIVHISKVLYVHN